MPVGVLEPPATGAERKAHVSAGETASGLAGKKSPHLEQPLHGFGHLGGVRGFKVCWRRYAMERPPREPRLELHRRQTGALQGGNPSRVSGWLLQNGLCDRMQRTTIMATPACPKHRFSRLVGSPTVICAPYTVYRTANSGRLACTAHCIAAILLLSGASSRLWHWKLLRSRTWTRRREGAGGRTDEGKDETARNPVRTDRERGKKRD